MANNFWKKAFGPVGMDPEELERDTYYEDSKYVSQEKESSTSYDESAFTTQRRAKVITMPENRRANSSYGQMKMVIYCPTSYEETQSVIDNLKARKPIIINLDEIDGADAQRILDFVSGAVYALGGDIRKAARRIFVVVPSNVEISTNLDMSYDEDYQDYEMSGNY